MKIALLQILVVMDKQENILYNFAPGCSDFVSVEIAAYGG